jgi:hypothetical protein
MSEEPQPQRVQQTMPADGGGLHQVEAGPHLHALLLAIAPWLLEEETAQKIGHLH